MCQPIVYYKYLDNEINKSTFIVTPASRQFKMTFIVIGLFILSTLSSVAPENLLKNPHYVPGHDAIVHLFEWKWSDVADECERFLGPMGYGGVQVSPVQENVVIAKRPWYERYQPISYKFVTRSGDESELKDMIKRCNKAGVRIYIDGVFNHMSGDPPNADGRVAGTGGSNAIAPAKTYPAVPFSSVDFHNTCSINNYKDATEVRNCELVGLHDLNQTSEHVRKVIVDFMNKGIEMGVAGFRIDAAKHMWPNDLEVIYSRLRNLSTDHGFQEGSRPYIFQEVIDWGGEAVTTGEYNASAAVTEFKYGGAVSSAMEANSPLKSYRDIGEASLWAMLPHQDALIFIDNHDTQREQDGGFILNYKKTKLYRMAVAFMLAHTYGNPKVMSSFAFDSSEQGPPADTNGNLISPEIKKDGSCGGGWVCEHRWRQIYNMIRFRNVVNGSKITEWWDNGNNQIAFSRGEAGFIAINADKSDLKVDIHTRLPAGLYCDIISGNIKNGSCTGKTVVVDGAGYAHIEILLNDEDGVLAIHREAKLE